MRVVHGGEHFSEAVVIDDKILEAIESLNHLAPLHNPVNVAGIKEARLIFPQFRMWQFSTLLFIQRCHPMLTSMGCRILRKEGRAPIWFSREFALLCWSEGAQYLKRRVNELEIISCHLGNGASLCAIDHGRSIDTTMGFTPGEGLIMGTRCGDIDPGVITYLEREHGLTGSKLINC
jgi:acetate kinase